MTSILLFTILSLCSGCGWNRCGGVLVETFHKWEPIVRNHQCRPDCRLALQAMSYEFVTECKHIFQVAFDLHAGSRKQISKKHIHLRLAQGCAVPLEQSHTPLWIRIGFFNGCQESCGNAVDCQTEHPECRKGVVLLGLGNYIFPENIVAHHPVKSEIFRK